MALILQAIFVGRMAHLRLGEVILRHHGESASMVRDQDFGSKCCAVVDWKINGNVAC